MASERRCAPRFAVAVEVEINGARGVTTNFSRNGVYFTTDQPLAPNQEVSLIFPFSHTVAGARAACAARVTRVDALPEAYGVGVTYEAISFDVSQAPAPDRSSGSDL